MVFPRPPTYAYLRFLLPPNFPSKLKSNDLMNSSTNTSALVVARYRRAVAPFVLAMFGLALAVSAGSRPLVAQQVKTASVFFPRELVEHARANAERHAWAAEIRDSLVASAQPWMELSDDELWELMFGNTIPRAWQVLSDGDCPACKKPVRMYAWVPDALNEPWKMRCPHCDQRFPTNDFAKFYRSGLDEHHVFDPERADRSLLFNTEHPDPSDPLHKFGVDDGHGYVEGDRRWRFINAYLIFGQWKQGIVRGINNLAAAYVATGDPAYAHKAGVLLDRVADLYPTFDFGKEGVMYEGPARDGYVSTWHDACVEVHQMGLAYDAVFEALARDEELPKFLAAKAAKYKLENPKTTWGDIQRNIEERIFRDTILHRQKIESNYPATDVTITTLQTVLDWPRNREAILKALDAIIEKATAVDGVTGEKGITGYSLIGPHYVADLLGWYARSNPDFLREMLVRHPRLHAMYRFHIDTWCLEKYYPRTGDTGIYGHQSPVYVGVPFSKNSGIGPSSYSFLWALYEVTGDKDFVRVMYKANGNSVEGLPYDLFAADPAALQEKIAEVIKDSGEDIQLASVNKTEWKLAILRSGEGANARAVSLDYDSGGIHGHADAMTMGLFAKGLDLLPDFGYPPVQYGGWSAPRAVWYTHSAAHNTVTVDGRNSQPGGGTTTLWFDGQQFHTVRASAAALVGGQQFERTLALVDISPEDAYVIDVFRVVGGREHTRYMHGYFGQLTTRGLSLSPTRVRRHREVMRNFQRDPQPDEGWGVTWDIEDRLERTLPDARLQLRHTDLTRDAEALLAESWVDVGSRFQVDGAWIPSVLTRRRAERAPLSSTFVNVLQACDADAPALEARRLALQHSDQTAAQDDDVAIEVRLPDGRKHIVVSKNTERENRTDSALVVPGDQEVQFEGDLCLIELDASGLPARLVLCRSQSLRVGDVRVQTNNAEASFEIELRDGEARIVSGPADGLESIEIAGRKVSTKP